MNLIKLLSWIAFLLILGGLLELSRNLHNHAFFMGSITLHFFSILIPVFIFTLFGILLNSKQLIKQYRSNGEWKINLSKFITLSLLPAVIVFFLNLFSLHIMPLDMIDLSTMSMITLILFGYYSIQSLYKSKY